MSSVDDIMSGLSDLTDGPVSSNSSSSAGGSGSRASKESSNSSGGGGGGETSVDSMGGGIALQRLMQERKRWRKDHPHGFFAKPVVKEENGVKNTNMMQWNAGITAKEDSPWKGGVYKLVLLFSDDYPLRPPKVQFRPPIFHPNVYESGTVCLSILNEDKGWKPDISLKQILLSIQDLLDDPNLDDPANGPACALLRADLDNGTSEYEKRVREEAMRRQQ